MTGFFVTGNSWETEKYLTKIFSQKIWQKTFFKEIFDDEFFFKKIFDEKFFVTVTKDFFQKKYLTKDFSILKKGFFGNEETEK